MMDIRNPLMTSPAPILSAILQGSQKNYADIRPTSDNWGKATIITCGNVRIIITGANHPVDVATAIGMTHLHNTNIDNLKLDALAKSYAS